MNPARPSDHHLKWRVFAAVGSGVFLATLDSSIINVSLPTLEAYFHTRFAVVQWVVLAYLLTVTTTMLGFGRLGDLFGKKKIYLIGFILFTAASALCSLSPTIYWLILARALQAVGAAMVMALGAAILTEAFPPEERGKAMGLIGLTVSAGIVVGPAIGGLILALLSWHWIFFVNLPVGIVGSWLVWRNIPADRPSGRRRFDIIGAVTLALALLAFLLALTWGQQYGFGHAAVLSLFAGALLLLLLFLQIEVRSANPMIDLEMFRDSLFSISLIEGFVAFVALSGTLILMPFYLENMLGLAPIKVGLMLGIVPLMLGIGSPIAGALSDRKGTRPISVVGLAGMVLGFLAAATLSLNTTTGGYLLRMAALGLGMGVFNSPNNSAIMGSVARGQLGLASGFMAVTRTLGQTVGVAVIGAIWAARTAVHTPGDRVAVTQAPLAAQIRALQETMHIAGGLVLLALLLAIGVLLYEGRRGGRPKASQR